MKLKPSVPTDPTCVLLLLLDTWLLLRMIDALPATVALL